MTTNDELALMLPESAAGECSLEEVFALLRERIARYTMGDHTSVPVDTARRLLEGILYCVDLSRRFPVNERSPDASLKDRLLAGSAAARKIAQRAKLLLYEAKRKQPPVTNRAFQETLLALPSFFRAYDVDFFAQEIPCSFDYPLCHPVSDALLGTEYMLDYLRRWVAESVFLRAFPAETLRALYQRYYIDYEDLLVNLYLPVAEMATLCSLLHVPVRGLTLSAEDYATANRLLLDSDLSTAQNRIRLAADDMLLQLGFQNTLLTDVTRQTAEDLLLRLRAAMQNSSKNPLIPAQFLVISF